MKAVHRLATLNDTNRLFDLRRQSIIKLAAKGMSIEEAARWAEGLTVVGMERTAALPVQRGGEIPRKTSLKTPDCI